MKNFFKFTIFKLITSIIVIALFITGRRLSALSDFPRETLFSKFDYIVFKPVYFLADLTGSLAGIVYFILDLCMYYFLACLLVFIIKKIARINN